MYKSRSSDIWLIELIGLAQAALVILKITGAITVSWTLVMSPSIFIAAVLVITFISVIIVSIFSRISKW